MKPKPTPTSRGTSFPYTSSPGPSPAEPVCLLIKAVPGAAATRLRGWQEGRLRIHIAAAPEDGKANAALCAFLAAWCRCPKKNVWIVSGERSRLKTVAIRAGDPARIAALMAPETGSCCPTAETAQTPPGTDQ